MKAPALNEIVWFGLLGAAALGVFFYIKTNYMDKPGASTGPIYGGVLDYSRIFQDTTDQ